MSKRALLTIGLLRCWMMTVHVNRFGTSDLHITCPSCSRVAASLSLFPYIIAILALPRAAFEEIAAV